jgi:hypothetical protein
MLPIGVVAFFLFLARSTLAYRKQANMRRPDAEQS